MSIDYSDELRAFDDELARLNMRGQWQQFGSAGKGGAAIVAPRNEPSAAGVPYIWRWSEVEPLLEKSCNALKESFTARRALAFRNPVLPRCTAQTIQMSVQVISPGEIAWAHRHTISALRFAIIGNDKLYTVVDGIAYRMDENDLVLTPKWTWHDHHNESDEIAAWLAVLDVPLVGALNQGFYEEFGETTQPIRNRLDNGNSGLRAAWTTEGGVWPGDCRYPWRDVEPVLRSFEDEAGSACDGILLDYASRATRGPTMTTLNCRIQRLPPGFAGRPHRHTSSAVYFVVGGEGATEAGERTMEWSRRDAFVVPNWTWHRHVNRSPSRDAILFTVSDEPVMRSLDFWREERA